MSERVSPPGFLVVVDGLKRHIWPVIAVQLC